MEDWIWIIFVVLGFGIWLVVTVFRKAEEERQRNQQQQRPRPNRGGRPTTDLDRFLEEARRRRGDGGAAGPARPPDLPWARPATTPPRRPAAPAGARRNGRAAFTPSVRRPATEPRPLVPSADRTLPPPKPALAPVILEIVPDDVPVTAELVVTPAERQAPPAPGTPLTQAAGILGRSSKPVSPFLKQLPGMLRQPQSTAMAFVLVEIFGPPVSKKGMK